MASDFNASSLSIKLSLAICEHNLEDSNKPENSYSNISSITATIQHELIPIGMIKANLFNKAAMEAISPAEMWQQCKVYVEINAPRSQLNKVENFLANQSFPADQQAKIDEAEWVLYIEEAYI